MGSHGRYHLEGLYPSSTNLCSLMMTSLFNPLGTVLGRSSQDVETWLITMVSKSPGLLPFQMVSIVCKYRGDPNHLRPSWDPILQVPLTPLFLDTKDDRFRPPFLGNLGFPNGAVHWILTLDHQFLVGGFNPSEK